MKLSEHHDTRCVAHYVILKPSLGRANVLWDVYSPQALWQALGWAGNAVERHRLQVLLQLKNHDRPGCTVELSERTRASNMNNATISRPVTAGADDRSTDEPAPKRARTDTDTAPPAEETANANNNNHAEGPTINGIPASQRLYSCGRCSKSYARLDHLSRHVRMHTQEKPYQCQTCTKAFARADLLKRHTLGHSKDDPQAKPTIVQHSRVSQACEACASLRKCLFLILRVNIARACP